MHKFPFPALATCLASTVLVGLIGCGAIPQLPESLDVATTATETLEANADTGPVGLAGGVWSLSRVADPQGEPEEPADDAPPGPYGGLLDGDALKRPPVGERIFLVHFGESGAMELVTENRFFLPQFYGREVPVGEDWRAISLPGLAFQSKSFGVDTGERFGLAVVVHVRFGNAYAGRAVLYAWGTRDGDAIDGTFGYLLDFSGGLLAFVGTVADQYPVQGERVE